MLRNALIFGGISGGLMAVGLVIGEIFHDVTNFHASPLFGYLFMLVAASLIFVGVKRHRDVALGGVIKFGPALGAGLAIALVGSVIYVVAWEALLAATDYAFFDQYAEAQLAAREARGASPEELAAFAERVEAAGRLYENPLFRIPITFTEVLPVGAIVALVSAALLRNPRLLPARR